MTDTKLDGLIAAREIAQKRLDNITDLAHDRPTVYAKAREQLFQSRARGGEK